MANIDAPDLNSKPVHGNAYGNVASYKGKAVFAAAPAAADKIRLCKVPAGLDISSVSLTNTDLGTAMAGTLQFEPTDGSALTVYATTSDLGTANPNGLLYAPNGFVTTKESYLVLLVGAVTAPAAGTVGAVVEGELVGAK